MSTFVVAISGASGAIYGLRLIQALFFHGHQINVIVSSTGRAILREETGVDLGATPASASARLIEHCTAQPPPERGGTLTVYGEANLHADIASGSVHTDAMVLAPCSMKTLSALANGYADDLISRAADVHIKEARRLIVVPRECPLSPIHLQNMLTLSRLEGVRILPAMPSFYSAPKSIDDLVDTVVARILDHIAPGIHWSPRWTGPSG